MSAKKSGLVRAVTTGMLAGIAAQLLLSSVYAFLIVRGRAEAEHAEMIMYVIAAVSALICGCAAVNSKGGTKLSALLSGAAIAAITVFGAVIICTDDIKIRNCAIISSIFLVVSYIGSVIKLGKSNKKIQKFRNKKK